MKRKITIIVLALTMVFTMSVSAFAGTEPTEITSISAKADWTKFNVNEVKVGAEIPKEQGTVESGIAITDGLIQQLAPEGYKVVFQGWVRQIPSGDWYSKGLDDNDEGDSTYDYFLDGEVYGIGIIFKICQTYKFSSDIKNNINIENADIVKIYDESAEVGIVSIVIKAGTVEEIQKNIAGTTAATTNGADTADSSNIALYSFAALLALAGVGIVGYKRREN